MARPVQRPPVISSNTVRWYEATFTAHGKRWGCKESVAELRARGLEPSVLCLEGCVYSASPTNMARHMIHAGVLYIPPEDMKQFLQLVGHAVGDCDICHHQVATARFPMFADVDFKLPDTVAGLRFMQKVVAAAQLSLHEPAVQAVLRSHHIPGPGELNMALLELLHARQPAPGAPPDMDDVIEVCCSHVDSGGKLADLLVEGARETVGAVFLMAVAVLFQRVVTAFYPPPANVNAMMIVLCNHTRTGLPRTANFGGQGGGPVCKYGAHLHMRGVVVAREQALYMWQAAVDYFAAAFPEPPCADGNARDFWPTHFV